MSHILREMTRGASLGWLMGVTTVVFFLTFLFWAWWAYTARNRARWEADSRMPFNDGADQ
jgi:cbb3-type cytochrome oxidase subunit 3